MKQIFLLCLACCFSGLLGAQESSPDTLHQRFEVGLNITNTLGNFVGSTGGLTNDPYLLSFRFGSATRRIRTGLSFKVQDKTDPDFSFLFQQKETTLRLRAGYEWVYPMSRRLGMYWGLDGIFESQTDDIKTTNQGGTASLQNRQWGIGGGPVLGLVWRVHRRVALTTESSMYAIMRRGTERVVAPPDFSTESVHEFIWQPLLPTSLYVNFSF